MLLLLAAALPGLLWDGPPGTAPDATEFTLPELKTYAVIDLSR
jgi:hypothetical protein